jgi:hypothetical protein
MDFSQDLRSQVLGDAQAIVSVPILEIQQAIVTELVLGKRRVVPILFLLPGLQHI